MFLTLFAILMIATQPATIAPAVDLQKLEADRKHKEQFYHILNRERMEVENKDSSEEDGSDSEKVVHRYIDSVEYDKTINELEIACE